MRLIDADALIEKYGDWYTEEGPEEGFIGTVKDIVNMMPDEPLIKPECLICEHCNRCRANGYEPPAAVDAIPVEFIQGLITEPWNAGSKSRVLSWLKQEWKKRGDDEGDKSK